MTGGGGIRRSELCGGVSSETSTPHKVGEDYEEDKRYMIQFVPLILG